MSSEKILLIYSTTKIDDNIKKTNFTYLKHYEQYFDKVICVYLMSNKKMEIKKGKTIFVSFNNSRSRLKKMIDLILCPFKLYFIIKRYKPTHITTPDLMFGGYCWIIAKIFTNFKLICYPVFTPEILHSLGISLTKFLPIWMEKALIRLSLFLCDRIIDAKNFTAISKEKEHWVLKYLKRKEKFKVIDKLPDASPPPEFLETLKKYKYVYQNRDISHKKNINIVCTSRLHKEKLIYDVIPAMEHLLTTIDRRYKIKLHIFGDGIERNNLETEIKRKKLSSVILLHGFVDNKKLPAIYSKMDIFLSPYTGSALREAMLCGLPVVAYNMDWISLLFKHKKNILLAERDNPYSLGKLIKELIENDQLYKSISKNTYTYANKLWNIDNLKSSIEEMFNF